MAAPKGNHQFTLSVRSPPTVRSGRSGKARIFAPLTLLGMSVVDLNFRPPSNVRITPVSFPVRYSFDFLASMNRDPTLPHLHIGSVLDFGPIRLGLASSYNPARPAAMRMSTTLSPASALESTRRFLPVRRSRRRLISPVPIRERRSRCTDRRC